MKHQGHHMSSQLNESDFLLILSCAIADSTQERKTAGKTFLNMNLPFLGFREEIRRTSSRFFKNLTKQFFKKSHFYRDITGFLPSVSHTTPQSLSAGFNNHLFHSTGWYEIATSTNMLDFHIQFIFLSRIHFSTRSFY